MAEGFNLKQLEKIVKERSSVEDGSSYTAQLIEKGVAKISEKFGEEAIELIVASNIKQNDEVKNEAADVIYHLMVLLAAKNIPLVDVLDVLAERTSQSGLAEKASRKT
jgi:phosphoribosyl-ATP pyrophosphohydrolase